MSQQPNASHGEQTDQPRILIVEDEALFAKAVCKRLRKAGYTCEVAGTLAQAEQSLAGVRPDLILLDMRLPDGSGLDFLHRLRTSAMREIAVIVLTAFGEIEDAVAAMKHQALDYLKKPIDLDDLVNTLERALAAIEASRQPAPAPVSDDPSKQTIELLGQSPAVARIRQQIERIGQLAGQSSGAPPTVLILGETGTGKDLAARFLHQRSGRRGRPFVHVDCAALPKDLIEAELFGHEKGAFTSAQSARTGLIEVADDGSVFLDEIAELPLELQVKLLAVLERRVLRRVGSSREQPVAAWFIAATNRDLEDMVRQGALRPDLYYRLKVLTLELPPLRQRGDDILLLARHYAEHTARRYGLPPPRFTDAALDALRTHAWPGNVRELINLIERAVLLHGGELLDTDALMLDEDTATAERSNTTGLTLEEAEATLIRQALEHSDGNVSQAARRLGITRMTLRYRMQKYGIAAPR